MITMVIGSNFKGLTFEQPLGRLNLLVGPNGSGKSARTQALILAVMGYIPGGAKKNAEILGAYGTEDFMSVGFKTDILFERGFARSGDSVSQKYGISGGRAKEGEFQKALGLHGNPRIVDISAFMELSDQKKIDAVFSLYPPAGDVNKIQGEIDGLREKINTLNAKAKSSEAAAARLVAAKPALPAGTLADVTGKISETETALAKARQDLSDAKATEAARVAKEQAEQKAAEDAEKLKAKQEKDQIAKEKKDKEEADRKLAEGLAEMTKECEQALGLSVVKLRMGRVNGIQVVYPEAEESLFPPHQGIEAIGVGAIELGMAKAASSIQAILDALKAAGCESCAARLVAVRELRKYEVKA